MLEVDMVELDLGEDNCGLAVTWSLVNKIP